MGEIFTGMGEILAAFVSGDSWRIRSALQGDASWAMGMILMLPGGFIIMMIYRFIPFIERHLESYVMVISYLTIGGIISFLALFNASCPVCWAWTSRIRPTGYGLGLGPRPCRPSYFL